MRKNKIEITPVSWVIVHNRFRFMIFGKVSQSYNFVKNTETHQIYSYVLKIHNVDWDSEIIIREPFKTLDSVVEYIKKHYKI